MTDLLITNIVYVAYRLLITANVIRFLNKFMGYYTAVLVAAQISFCYDLATFYFYFGADALPPLLNILYSDISYTLRVIAAWFVIKQLWDWIGYYWVAVFIGAELTFVVDYFIFGSVY